MRIPTVLRQELMVPDASGQFNVPEGHVKPSARLSLYPSLGGCYNPANLILEGIRQLGLTREEVLHIARLARVGLSEEDVARFQEQLSEILDHFDVLRQVDTESVPPTSHTLDLQNVTSPDQVRDSFPRKEILGNAPLPEEGFFRVRAVLDE